MTLTHQLDTLRTWAEAEKGEEKENVLIVTRETQEKLSGVRSITQDTLGTYELIRMNDEVDELLKPYTTNNDEEQVL